MKIAILISFLISLSGCQTTGRILQGMGEGLQNSARNQPQATSTTCTTNGYGGLYTTNCLQNGR